MGLTTVEVRKKYEVWLANLDPKFGTEAGKARPFFIIQGDILNKYHLSTLICPITTNVKSESKILRVHLKKGVAGVKEDCDVMMDQIRPIENKRLLKIIGSLPTGLCRKIKEKIRIILVLEE